MKKVAAYCMTRDLYAYAVPSIKSLLVNSDVDTVYLIIEDDEFPVQLPRVKVINAKDQTFFPASSPNFNQPWTYMVLMRAALHKVLKESRVLSLDYDTIIDGDISELWDLPLSKFYLAGGYEPHKTTPEFLYVNAGVMMLNLRKLRDGKGDEIVKALNKREYAFNEQDAINEHCQGGIYILPPEYNVHTWSASTDKKPIIMHYAGIDRDSWRSFGLVQKYAKIEVEK